ncbi:MAG: glycoside hydrolase family 38 N-terminal domain-containing protein [Actinomycetota bacterium]
MPGHVTIIVVPHTHWDREWYQPFDEFLERLVAMMDTLIELGDAGFPHFHLDGQTAMVDDYLSVRPENEAAIRRLAAEGRLSLGPWFTQMDEFLTSGETHIRNLERGLARGRELGSALEVGYMPDQFGHIGQMPQILSMRGLERAVVWRGVSSEIECTSFRWAAPDGSTVTTEYLAFSYANGESFRKVADPHELAAAIVESVEHHRPFLPTERMLVMMGTDHAGPDPTLPDRIAAAVAELPDVDVRIGGLATHLAGLEPGDVPAWRGELRSSARAHLLPNVYSARAPQKRERGRVEALVERYAEPLAALTAGFAWPEERLDRAWRLLLWNGAHDSACGCSHDQVGRDVDARFAEARSIAEGIAAEALAALGSRVSGAGTLRFNPSPFERDGVPALGWSLAPAPDDEVEVEPALEDGWIVADGVSFTFRDEPDVGDLYNYCHAEDGQVAAFPDEIRVEGPTVVATFPTCQVAVRLRKRAGERFLRLEGAIDNTAPDHRLRLHVRLGSAVEGSVAGSPFELVDRPIASEGSSLETASPNWPARQVVLAGDRAAYHEGVFEYEVAGDELAIALLRAVGTISRDSMPTRPWPAGPGVPTPEAQLIGRSAFALGLRGGATRDDLLSDWERFALPLLRAEAAGGGDLQDTGSLLELDGEAQLSNVRRHDGGVEVRLWNHRQDRSVHARVDGSEVELGPARIETITLGEETAAG